MQQTFTSGKQETGFFSPHYIRCFGGCGLSCDDLAGRAHSQPEVRLVFVVVFEQAHNQSESSLRIWQPRFLVAVTLERFHADLKGTLAVRTQYRRKAGLQTQLAAEDLCVHRDVSRLIATHSNVAGLKFLGTY